MTIYKGFSTYNRSKRFTVTDFDLIKQDLFNHFNMRRGEKLMNPGYGSIIWDLMFEPLDDGLKESLIEEDPRIVGSEPRVLLEKLGVEQYEHGIMLVMTVNMVTENLADQLIIDFNKDTGTAYMV
jgi:phage baseplate assembly protein W